MNVSQAKNGYNGDINLLIAVRDDQTIAGVDLLSHRETPGLGDRIEARKSNWLKQFVGRFLDPDESVGWGVKRDGGEFDQLTGATVTPRSVVNALRAALNLTSKNHRLLFGSARPQLREGTPDSPIRCVTLDQVQGIGF